MTKTELDPYLIARVIASRAFGSIRGRRSSGTGAAPAHYLAELSVPGMPSDKRTVSRQVMGGRFPGSPPPSTATSFDYAMAALFDWELNGGKNGFAAGIEAIASILGDFSNEELLKAIASLMRTTVQSEVDQPDRRFLTGFAVQALAIEYVNETEFRRSSTFVASEEEETLVWARWLLHRRRLEIEQTTDGFAALLSFGLLLLGRRPRAGYSLIEIVRAVQALWTGSLFHYQLDPTLFPEYATSEDRTANETTGLPVGNGVIERAMVDLLLAMTEESVFAARTADQTESRVVEEALGAYQTAKHPVEVVEASRQAGASPTALSGRFPSQRDLAQACLASLAGEWDGLYRFADQFRTAAPAGAEALLVWVRTVRTDYPVLLEAAGFVPGDRTFDELVMLIATLLSCQRHGQSGVPSPDTKSRARRCLLAARDGGDWHDQLVGRPSRARNF